MNRPIKFRGRLWDTGEFVFGNFVTDDQEYLIKFGADSFTCPAKIFKIQKNSVAQLVGFDKNGREVYEGDELDWHNGGGTIRIPQIYAKQYNYPLKGGRTMKHSIRERIIDPVRGKIVKESTVNAELGTGVFDKHGREIFEGDRVKSELGEGVIIFDDCGGFALDRHGERYNPLSDFIYWGDCELEIVGHAED